MVVVFEDQRSHIGTRKRHSYDPSFSGWDLDGQFGVLGIATYPSESKTRRVSIVGIVDSNTNPGAVFGVLCFRQNLCRRISRLLGNHATDVQRKFFWPRIDLQAFDVGTFLHVADQDHVCGAPRATGSLN